MAILADYHLHSSHSFDSEAPMEDVVKCAIEKKLEAICFTEHMDYGFPVSEEFPEHAWELNVDSYLYDLLTLKQKYEKELEIYFGIELGLQESVFKENAITAKSHDFDFILGSIHLVNGRDPYEKDYFDGKTDKEAIKEYLMTILANIKKFQNFDCLGHLDYIVRVIPGGDDAYRPSDYTDLIEEILSFLIENEKGIELNTAPLYRGHSFAHPHPEILKRYRELGGEVITIGSDAHKASRVGYGFDRAEEFLKEAGFKYYCTFSNRIANFKKLG